MNNTNPPAKDLKSTDHFSYLLRLWRTNGQWRASVETPETGKRIGFANLEQLFVYLMDLIESKVIMQHSKEEKGKNKTGKRD